MLRAPQLKQSCCASSVLLHGEAVCQTLRHAARAVSQAIIPRGFTAFTCKRGVPNSATYCEHCSSSNYAARVHLFCMKKQRAKLCKTTTTSPADLRILPILRHQFMNIYIYIYIYIYILIYIYPPNTPPRAPTNINQIESPDAV